MKKEKIELISQKHNEINFHVDHTYGYQFTLDSEIEKHDLLLQGFSDDMIEILKHEFGEALKKYIKKKQNDNTI